MRLLFFIPGAQAVTAELLQQHGLTELLPTSRQSRSTMDGVDGVPGLLLASDKTSLDRLVVDKSKQSWSPRFGCSSMVGHWNDDPPTLDDFRRDQQHDGIAVKLLDGAEWLVPVLREWREDLSWAPTLPRVMQQCAKTGQFLLGAVVPQHRELWETSLQIAHELLEQLRTADAGHIDYARLFNFAIDVLRVNYRVDASIVSHLCLLTPELGATIVRAALDWESFRNHLKNAPSRLPPAVGTDTKSGATQQIEG